MVLYFIDSLNKSAKEGRKERRKKERNEAENFKTLDLRKKDGEKRNSSDLTT